MLLEEIKGIKSTIPEVRKFGFTIGAVLLVIGGLLLWKEKPSFWYFGAAALTFAALGLIAPIILKPVFRAWMTFAVVMGFVMTRVILGVMFYGIFTPVSLLLRLLRKDLLQQQIDQTATSYWIKRPRAKYEPQTSERMF